MRLTKCQVKWGLYWIITATAKVAGLGVLAVVAAFGLAYLIDTFLFAMSFIGHFIVYGVWTILVIFIVGGISMAIWEEMTKFVGRKCG